MKTKIIVWAGVLCAGLLLSATAAEKVQAGPKGGRLLERTTPRAEFFVEKDRTVSITFYDASGRPVAPVEQTVTVIAEGQDGKHKLEFARSADALVSKTKLPEGDAPNVVVQLKQTPEAKPQNFRFKADLSMCSGCQRAEYACTCHE
jgi:hypothetical protein